MRRKQRPPGWPVMASYLLLGAGAAVMLWPLVWMVLTSFKGPGEVLAFPPGLLPSRWRWENYVEAWRAAPFDRFFLNSLLVASLSTAGTLVSSSLAGYAFARLRFWGRDGLFALVVATLAVPMEITIVPAYLLVRTLGWVDTYWALIVPGLASAFGVFLMRQAFLSLPRELEEAAQIDGCGPLRFLFTVAIPLHRPALATLGLFHFVSQWNSYLWPLLVTNREAMRPVQVGLRYFLDEDLGSLWGPLMAAATMVMLPTLVIFVLAQRQLVRAFTLSGLKG